MGAVELYPDACAVPGVYRAIAAWVAVVDGKMVARGHRRCVGITHQGGELMAAADSIQWAIAQGYESIRIFPDCKNVAEGLQGRIEVYAAKDWKRKTGKNNKARQALMAMGHNVSARELTDKEAWIALYAAYTVAKPILSCERIPSHSGHLWNDAVDKFAKQMYWRWQNEGGSRIRPVRSLAQ